MKSRNYRPSIIVVLAALTVLAFAAVANVQADVIVCFPMDTNPGWNTQGQWAFGVPLGSGSHCGDPISGHTGTNVYGYNLSGDYTNNMSAYRLTTTALDCSDYENVTLRFWRWLGVESSSYDHAKVEVSNNGSTWVIVWDHTGGSFCDGDWIECIYDISAIADDQSTVYIRWTMGPTDGSVTYPGWNIDDVCLLGDLIDDLDITPPEDFISSGNEGGPFAPNSKTYTLMNNGPNSLDWTVTVTEPWLDVAPSSGTLTSGADVDVDISINANADALPTGTHTDTVTFINTTSGIIQTREVVLAILPAGTIFYDTFSSTTIDGANWTICAGEPTIDDIGISEPSPPYSLRLNGYPSGGDCVVSRTLNLSGMAEAELTYWYQRTGGGEDPDGGEDLVIEYWNGSSWLELARYPGDGPDMTNYEQSIIILPSGAMHSGFKLRISSTGTSDPATVFDDWFVDDVFINILDDLGLNPSEDFNSVGYEGGPFTPPSKVYTLTNTGPDSLNWTASATQPWLDVTPGSGILPSGASATVNINTDANTLLPGSYSDVVTFTNMISGFVQRRNVYLQVLAIPGEIEVTDSIPPVNDMNMPFADVFIGMPRTEKITITNTNPNYSLIITDISLHRQPTSTVETSELLVKLPGTTGGTGDSDLSYLPTGWVTPERSAAELLVSSGYRVLTNGINVLLLASGDDPIILRTALTAFPDIETVDYFDCSISSPTGDDLASYDVVVVMSNSGFSDSTQTGNVLADYVDAGGEVLQAVATFSYGGGWELGGRFVTQEGYEPFVHGDAEFFPHSLGAFDADHPIMDGVTALTDGFPVGVTLKANAEWVADWDNGTPLVATQGHNVVGINIFVFDSGDFTGDVPLLFHNAIVWLAEGTAEGFELTGLPELPVPILPFDHLDVNVVFEPTDVKTYAGTVIIKSNDDDEPELEVQLSGSGILDYLDITDVNFVFSGHPGGPFVPSNQSYQLTNIGHISIEWTAGPNVPWLDVQPLSGTLQPGDSTTVTIAPNSQADTVPEGYYCGQVIFTDLTTTLQQGRKVCLNVYTEPKVWAQPHQFDVTISQGESTEMTLTIGNNGGSPLEFDLLSQETGYIPWLPEEDTFGLVTDINDVLASAPPDHNFTVLADANYAEGELLVRFAPDPDTARVDSARCQAILSSFGSDVILEYAIVPGLSLVQLPPGMTVQEALIRFNKTQGVLYAEPNYEIKLLSNGQIFPNDPLFVDLWNIHNTGQTGGTFDADIDGPEAWYIERDCSRTVVAVLDSGIDYHHFDLASNMWVNQAEFAGTPGVDDDGNGYIDDVYGYDFADHDPDPMDYDDHGTHVAGTIGAIGDNATGVTGLCWEGAIMALKIFPNYSEPAFVAGAIEAIEYAYNNGARVLSNSWGGGPYNQSLKDAIDRANDAGVLFIASAGNDYRNNDVNPHYPSSFDCENIIAVLSTDHYDGMSFFSNYGPMSVDLGAPGSYILSCEPGDRYQYMSGTSMSSPHVSAACASLWSMCPSASHLEIKDIILQTVDPTLPGLCVSGGRLNLHNALLEAEASCSAPWITFVPQTGTVAAGDSNSVCVIFDGERPPGIYNGHITLSSDDPYVPELFIPVELTVEQVDYFTELFDPQDPPTPNDPNSNDLTHVTLTFRPDASPSYYSLCIEEANAFPVEPNGGTAVVLGDDDYEAVPINDAQLDYYGHTYDTLYIGSNGYITFASGDFAHFETLEEHFALPRISALFDDLDPSAGGTISWKQLDDRVVVTFENVPEYSMSNSNSFQIEMRFNGKIRITLLDIAAKDGLVGLSEGSGLPPYLRESDLSKYNVCTFTGDLNGDLNVDLHDFAIFGTYWQSQYDETETVRDEFNTVSYSGSDGTQNWSNDWQESGESDGPGGGFLQVVEDGRMRIGDKNVKTRAALNLTRAADLSCATKAVLTYDYAVQKEGNSGSVDVQVSGDGGANWNTLATYSYNTGSGSANLDITSYISSDTQIRFEMGPETRVRMYLYVDNIQIEYDDAERPWYDWCNGSDFNQDFRIDSNDLRMLCEHWLD